MARSLRLIIPLAALLVLAVAAPARAQSSLTWDSLLVELWPEYDQPQVLVILTGTLAADARLPAAVEVRLPARAGQPSAVAVEDPSGQLLTAEYTTTPAGDDLLVTVNATQPVFRVEYYDSALQFNAQQREFQWNWTSIYEVRAATVRVQEPVNATGFSAQPALTALGSGAFGLLYNEGSLGALRPGQAMTLAFTYSKPDSLLSAEAVGPPQPLASAATSATDQPALLSPLMQGGLVVSILLIAAGAAYWYWTAVRHPAAATARAHRRRIRTNSDTITPLSTPKPAARFCAQCGAARVTGDHFCRQCGAAFE